MNDKYPMTDQGFARLESELRQLKTVTRPEVIRAIAEIAWTAARAPATVV